jgi:hypothetical protein
MIQVTVELWPGGDASRAQVIATASVAHVSNLADLSDYVVKVEESHNPIVHSPPWSRSGKISRHDRRASIWSLIARVAAWAADEAKETT